MSIDLWVEVTEENIERLIALHVHAYPRVNPRHITSIVNIGRYINYDTSYPTLQLQLHSYASTRNMHIRSRMVDVDELMLAVFEQECL